MQAFADGAIRRGAHADSSVLDADLEVIDKRVAAVEEFGCRVKGVRLSPSVLDGGEKRMEVQCTIGPHV